MKVLEIIRSYERFGWFNLDMVAIIDKQTMKVTKRFHTAEERDAVRPGDEIEP